jgi:hypothetical protein
MVGEMIFPEQDREGMAVDHQEDPVDPVDPGWE